MQPAFSSPPSTPQGLPSSSAEQASGEPAPGQLCPVLSSFASLGWGHTGTPAGDKYDSAGPGARTETRTPVQGQNPPQYERPQISFEGLKFVNKQKCNSNQLRSVCGLCLHRPQVYPTREARRLLQSQNARGLCKRPPLPPTNPTSARPGPRKGQSAGGRTFGCRELHARDCQGDFEGTVVSRD